MPDRKQVRPGSWFTFILKIHKTKAALQKSKLDPGGNIFLHLIFWILMPDSNLVRPGSWFTFSLKINKTPTAL